VECEDVILQRDKVGGFLCLPVMNCAYGLAKRNLLNVSGHRRAIENTRRQNNGLARKMVSEKKKVTDKSCRKRL